MATERPEKLRAAVTTTEQGAQVTPSPAKPAGHGPQVKRRPLGSAAAGTSAHGEPGKQGEAEPYWDGLLAAAQPSESAHAVSPVPL